MEQEWRVRLNAKQRTRRNLRHLTIEFPHLDRFTFHNSANVSIVGRVDSVKDLAVCHRPLQLHVFRVRPQEWHRRIGWTTNMEMLQRRIWTIPDLLWDQTNALREFFNCVQKRSGVKTGGDFVMTALTRQERPRTPLSPTGVRSAIFSLAKAVMIVAAPAGSIRRVHFENTIVDDLFRRKFNARAGRLIREYQRSAIWVLIRTVNRAGRIHANVVAANAGHQRSFGSHRPQFDVRFKKASVITNESGGAVVASIGEELSRADKRCDVY